jgi:hypothetical protein
MGVNGNKLHNDKLKAASGDFPGHRLFILH